ncbi:Uncharacterised protein [Pandoraea pnomenusa]|uniref:Uncharacterized protein n=1 Tax=Pandoraea pnomenusa TaxID=93220 RepID=A0A378YZG1_9BURK|nr:Uncharacterised protein [Pandoraea pnomenusa]
MREFAAILPTLPAPALSRVVTRGARAGCHHYS